MSFEGRAGGLNHAQLDFARGEAFTLVSLCKSIGVFELDARRLLNLLDSVAR